jgi:flagellar protein FliO/FliZ
MAELTIRIAFSLLIVLGLMWGMAKVLRRPLAGRTGGALAVLARQQLTKGSSVAVIRVADRALILGVTDAGVSLLADADIDVIEAYQSERNVRREPVTLPAQSTGGTEQPTTSTRPVGGLNGSILSPSMWKQAASALRTGGRRV